MAAMFGGSFDSADLARQASYFATQRLTDLAGKMWILLVPAAFYTAAWVRDGFPAPAAPRLRKPVQQLRTKRLLLRRFRPDDLYSMHAIMSDAETLRYWNFHPHATLEDTRVWLQEFMGPPSDESDDFVIEHDGKVIGMLGSKVLPWVGFVLARGAWNQGFATEALAAFTRYIFRRRLAFVVAQTDVRNAAARGLLARAGFREFHRGPFTHEGTGEAVELVCLRLDHPRHRMPTATPPSEDGGS
jgi:[ribosomal protein S5]-alanine N-acetyltransferase